MDTKYVFRVAAINRFGIGEYSDEAMITTKIPFTAPILETIPRISALQKKVSFYFH